MIPSPRRSRRGPAAALAVAVAIAHSPVGPPAPPARAQAVPPSFENVTLLSGGHHVFAKLTGVDESTPSRWVAAAILPRAGACALPACDPETPRATAHAATIYDGSLEFAFVTAGPFQRRPVRLSPGDRVRLRTIDGGAPAEAVLTVGDVTVTAVDIAADRLSGTGPPGARLSITANRPDGSFKFTSTTVSADGTWTADLADKLDLVPGASGAVTAGGEGVVTQASWVVPRAVVRFGDPSVDVVAGAGDVVTVTQAWDGFVPARIAAFGRSVVWRGSSAPAAVVLRHVDSGQMASVPDSARTTIAFGIQGRPEVGRTSLPLAVDVDVEKDEIRSHEAWPTGRFAVDVGGLRRIVDTTGGSAAWTVPLSDRLDLTMTLPVDVSALDETAPIGWSMRAYPWHITSVDPTYLRVTGRGTAGRAVFLGRGDGEWIARATVAPDGTFAVEARDDAGALERLVDGTSIEVEEVGVRELRTGPGCCGGPNPKEDEVVGRARFAAAPLRAAALANREVVRGTALPGARITVRVGDARDGRSIDVAASLDGSWEADFADVADLTPGMPVEVEATAADGYRSTLAFPVFRASAQVGGDRVIIDGHPGLSAEVEVARGGDVVGTAACTVADGATSCAARVRAVGSVLALVMRPDDEVVVLPNEGASASLRLVPFSAHVDPNARSVVGNCPPGGRMLVRFHAPEGSSAPYDSATTADGNGVCDYELSRGEWDLMQPGLTADLIHPLEDGHRLFSTGVYEHVRLIHNGPIEGLAEPFSVVTVTLRSAAGVDSRLYSVRADGDGRWTSDLPGANRNVHRPELGGSMLVDDLRRRHILPYTPLVGWWDDRLGSVVGLTAPDQPVKIVHDLAPQADGRYGLCHGPSDFSTAVDVADPLGTFAFAAPPADACAVGRAEIAVVLPSGNEVRFRLPEEIRPGGRAFLPIGQVGRP